MPTIKDDLTLAQLHTVMSYVKPGVATHEDVVETVHTALRRPENVFYRDLGHGRGMWVARNNTIICPHHPEPTAYYLGGCRWI